MLLTVGNGPLHLLPKCTPKRASHPRTDSNNDPQTCFPPLEITQTMTPPNDPTSASYPIEMIPKVALAKKITTNASQCFSPLEMYLFEPPARVDPQRASRPWK